MLRTVSIVFQVLTYVDIIFFLILTVFLLFNLKRLPWELKIFSFFVSIVFAINALSLGLAKFSIPNTPLFHLLFFVQIIWFVIHYFLVLKEWVYNKSILIFSGGFLGLSIWKYATDWVEVTNKIGGLYYFISTVFFVVFAVLFYVLMLMGKITPKYQLINAAILIYYSCSSVIFLFSKYYYLEGFEGQMILWVFNIILHMLFVLLIFVDVWRTLHPRPKT
jgi:hypothetical protein